MEDIIDLLSDWKDCGICYFKILDKKNKLEINSFDEINLHDGKPYKGMYEFVPKRWKIDDSETMHIVVPDFNIDFNNYSGFEKLIKKCDSHIPKFIDNICIHCNYYNNM